MAVLDGEKQVQILKFLIPLQSQTYFSHSLPQLSLACLQMPKTIRLLFSFFHVSCSPHQQIIPPLEDIENLSTYHPHFLYLGLTYRCLQFKLL